MKDCEVILRVSQGKVIIESKEVTMEDLATLAGYLLTMVATKACRDGMDIDDMKNGLLDLCLAAGDAAEASLNGLHEYIKNILED